MKKILRLFSLLLVLCILSCSVLPVSVSAVDLYPATPIRWCNWNTTNGNVRIYWCNYNIPNNTQYSLLYNALSPGIAYWSDVNHLYTNCSVTTTKVVSSATYTGQVYFILPTESWWDGATGLYCEDATAYTTIFDTNGTQIDSYSVANSTRKVKVANIYFNSTQNGLSGLTSANLKCTVAHEVGHALGFAHYGDHMSIMYNYTKNHLSLWSDDIDFFTAKYRVS